MFRSPLLAVAFGALALSPLHAQNAPATPSPAKATVPAVSVPELAEMSRAPDSETLLLMVQAADAKVASIADPSERALTKATLDALSAKPKNFRSILATHAANLEEIRNKVPETLFLTGISRCKTDADIVSFARETYSRAEKLGDPSLRRIVRFTLAKLEDRPGEARDIMKAHLKSVGERFYAAAKASFDANDAKSAMESIQVAVRCAPEHVKARFLFAHLLHLTGDTANAVKTLRAGLAHVEATSPDATGYLDRYFQLLEANEGDAEVIAQAGTLLMKPGFPEAAREMLAMHLATSLTFTGRDEDAVKVIRANNLGKRVQGRLLEARALFDGRKTEAAVSLLENSLDDFRGLERDALLSQLQRFFNDLGRDERALAVARQRIDEIPGRSAPRVHRLWIYRRRGDDATLRKEAASILKDHKDDQGALIGMANLAADAGYVGLADDCFRVAQTTDFDRQLFALLTLEARVNSHAYRDAILMYESFVSANKDFFKGQSASIGALLAAANFGLGDSGSKDIAERRLKEFLDAKGLRPEHYVSTGRLLRRAGAQGYALRVLAKGHAAYPWNNQLHADYVEARIATGDTTASPSIADELLAVAKGRRVHPKLWAAAARWIDAGGKTQPADKLRALREVIAANTRSDLVKDTTGE